MLTLFMQHTRMTEPAIDLNPFDK